ncbi:MAG: hypothetical protein JNL74_06350 [Fibrobacteres bacterium]|nr:hypothetical protein [Fibrobacterota bacterium]
MRPYTLFLLSIIALMLVFDCSGVFVNPDGKIDEAQNRKESFTVKGIELTTAIEQQIVNEFRSIDLQMVPEGHFFELQDRMLHAVRAFYTPSAKIEFLSEKRAAVPRTQDMDTPKIDPKYYLGLFKKDNLSVYSISTTEPPVIRSVLRSGKPILLFGELYYNRFLSKPDGEARLFRRHETFDVLTGYSLLSGPKSNLPGEDGDQYLYKTRTGFSFTSYENGTLINKAMNIYGVANGSRWIFSNAYVMLPDSVNIENYTSLLELESGINDISFTQIKF